jgi:hypothetical protein
LTSGTDTSLVPVIAEAERAPGFQHEIEGCPVAGDEQHEGVGFYALYRVCKIADGLHGLAVHLLNDIPHLEPGGLSYTARQQRPPQWLLEREEAV